MPTVTTTSNLTFSVDTVAKFKPHAVVVSKRFWSSKKSEREKSAIELANLEKGKLGEYNGYMSPATRRQVKGIIENKLTAIQLCTKLKFPDKLPSEAVFPTFVTLTLPCKQIHSDEDLRRYCFGPFIQYMTGDREKGLSGWGVRAYLWVAETQANGNLHFHLLIDRAVPWRRIRDAWNRCLQRLEYISDYGHIQRDTYKRGFFVRKEMLQHAIDRAKRSARAQKKRFGTTELAAVVHRETERQQRAYDEGVANDWSDPNTTDIHAIQNIRKLTAYVTKYMTKEPDKIHVLPDGQVLGKLAENQRIEERGGKAVLVTRTVETGTNVFTGEVFTVENATELPLTVKMLRRRMRGRIWGRADCLAQPDPDAQEKPLVRPFEATIKRVEKHDVVDHIDTRVVRQVAIIDLVGNHSTQLVEERFVKDNPQPPRWVHTENDLWQEYLKHLRDVVPEEDRTAATAKVGERFAQDGGEIIPLRTPQKELLRKHSTPAFQQYFAHYARIFRHLWGEPTDPLPGGASGRPDPQTVHACVA